MVTCGGVGSALLYFLMFRWSLGEGGEKGSHLGA